jgi:hypothetical protein
MFVLSNLRRILALLISISMLLGAPAAFASVASGCDQMQQTAHMDMAGMSMKSMNAAAQDVHAKKPAHNNAPCKTPSGDCIYLCGVSASAAIVPIQDHLFVLASKGDLVRAFNTVARGISQRPDLPPPILSV